MRRKNWISLIMAMVMMAMLFAPMSVQAAEKALTVSTQKKLESALKTKGVTKITIKTSNTKTFTIPEGEYEDITLVISAAKGTVSNHGIFDVVQIKDAKKYKEYAGGNMIKVTDSKLTLNVEKGSSVDLLSLGKKSGTNTVVVNGEVEKLKVTAKMTIKLTVNANVEIMDIPSNVVLKMEGKAKEETKEEAKPKDEAKLDYTVDYTGAIPSETGARKLTDKQLKKLASQTPEQAAKTITTLADAYAWLKQEGYSTHGASLNWLDGGTTFELGNGRWEKEMAWEEMSTTINILLEGDYDEVGTVLCTLVPNEDGWAFFYSSFNYVKVGNWYYITDPVCHLNNGGLPFCRAYTIKTSTLTDIKEILAEINLDFSPITIVSYPLTTKGIRVKLQKDPIAIAIEDVSSMNILFQANEADFKQYEAAKEQARKDEMAGWEVTARRIDIQKYGMPAAIGKQNLDYDEALALVGKDPEVIAKEVKSVADAVQYMIAARFGYYSDYFGTPWYGFWGFDAPGDYQLKENYACCCGGYANTASYLLKDNYEKVGTLRWVGGGNHTISWVYTGGKYYVFDFTQYSCMGNYNNYNCPVIVLDRLEDFYDNMPDKYDAYAKAEIVIMVAFEAADAMYPSNWNDPPYFTGLTFPEEAKGKVTLIYQKDPSYGVGYKKVDVNIPGWNAPY